MAWTMWPLRNAMIAVCPSLRERNSAPLLAPTWRNWRMSARGRSSSRPLRIRVSSALSTGLGDTGVPPSALEEVHEALDRLELPIDGDVRLGGDDGERRLAAEQVEELTVEDRDFLLVRQQPVYGDHSDQALVEEKGSAGDRASRPRLRNLVAEDGPVIGQRRLLARILERWQPLRVARRLAFA